MELTQKEKAVIDAMRQPETEYARERICNETIDQHAKYMLKDLAFFIAEGDSFTKTHRLNRVGGMKNSLRVICDTLNELDE